MSAQKHYANKSAQQLHFYTLHKSMGINTPEGETQSTAEIFHAFLTSFNQTFNSTWNQQDVYGRNDPIATFQGTKRTMNLAFDIPSANIDEAEANQKRLARLTQMLYPQYSSGRQEVSNDEGTFMVGSNALTLSKPPLIRLRYANLICDSSGREVGLLGFISNLGITPVLDMGMFEMDKKLYPKVFSITFDFTVLHEHDLGYDKLQEMNISMKWFPFGKSD
tara:strand:- start:1875 stop:2537 length:663 start_codon:yes stop_codon:yes gene_type:complete